MASHSLQIEIGAVLNGSFGATMSSSTSLLTKLGSTIKQLESSSKGIGQFQNLKNSTLTAKNEWAQAEAQVKSLAIAMNHSRS
jgi:hypothetical protein